jgi:hypothetical protein
MVNLLRSEVFNYSFDYDEWPSSHFNAEDVSKPYNGSVFDIRYKRTYTSLFPEIEEMNDEDNVDETGKKRQIYKIKYTVNLLPRLASHIEYIEDDNGVERKTEVNGGICIMYLCVFFAELDVFDTDSIRELIDFKWIEFGQFHHMIGLCFHMCQMVVLMIYINNVYIVDAFDIYKPGGEPSSLSHPQSMFAFSLLICLIYPFFYEGIRMTRETLVGYFSNPSNYAQLFYVMCSILMTVFHILTLPQNFGSKLIMILVIWLSIARTFKQMRIMEVFAHIVEMLFQVTSDLKVFIFFYMIIIVLFSMLISVLGIGNPAVEPLFKEELYYTDEETGETESKYNDLG